MIDYIFGKPRTGKSYRAVKIILDNFMTEGVEPPYRHILTNIGGFKFDLVNRYFEDHGHENRAYLLRWKIFYDHLKKMHEMALDEKSDDELIRYARYHKIDDSWIFLDEASLYLKKYDKAVSWFLAYHGHFKIRITVLAQSPKQIYSEFMEHTEIFINAQPQSKQLRSNVLRYIHYDEPSFRKDNKFSSDSIKTSPDVYALYKSGEVDKPKKIIYKFIGLAGIAALFVFFLFSYFMNSLSDRAGIDEHEPDLSQDKTASPQTSSPVTGIDRSSSVYVHLRCNEQACWNSDPKYENREIPINYFKHLVVLYELKLEYYEVANEVYKMIPLQRGSQKVVLASLTDYFYFIPQLVADNELRDLFVLRKEDKPASPFENMQSPESAMLKPMGKEPGA